MIETQRKLITVSEVFEIAGRGLALSPVVPHALIGPDSGEQLKPGDELELRRPDGTIKRVKLYGLEWFRPSKGGLGLTFSPAVSKLEIPIGTEIWTVGTEG